MGNILWLVPFAGAAAVGRALWEIRMARRLHEVGVAVMGVVTDIRVRWKSSGENDSYRIVQVVLRFQTEDGRAVETVSSEGAGNSPRAEIGEDVPVLYDPDDPQRARIEGISGIEIFRWAMYCLVGGVFLLFGLAAILG
jgi:Protein of unknown function (DUF3592)